MKSVRSVSRPHSIRIPVRFRPPDIWGKLRVPNKRAALSKFLGSGLFPLPNLAPGAAQPQRSKGFPKSFRELRRRFATEEACRGYLFELRWPAGLSLSSLPGDTSVADEAGVVALSGLPSLDFGHRGYDLSRDAASFAGLVPGRLGGGCPKKPCHGHRPHAGLRTRQLQNRLDVLTEAEALLGRVALLLG
jgi:hypothetical protein